MSWKKSTAPSRLKGRYPISSTISSAGWLRTRSRRANNNHIENRIRPVALGRSNWLFAGSLRAGKRAAVIMSLIQSAKLNGHDPYLYLKDILELLSTHSATRLEELLPHRWQSALAH